MPITVWDIIEEGGKLEITCGSCRKVVWITGRDQLLRYNPKLTARQLQAKLVCPDCDFPGEIKLTFPSEEIKRAKSIKAHNTTRR